MTTLRDYHTALIGSWCVMLLAVVLFALAMWRGEWYKERLEAVEERAAMLWEHERTEHRCLIPEEDPDGQP